MPGCCAVVASRSHFPLLGSGSLVGQSQVLLLENGDMQARPQESMDKVCEFLELSKMQLPDNVQEEIGLAYVPFQLPAVTWSRATRHWAPGVKGLCAFRAHLSFVSLGHPALPPSRSIHKYNPLWLNRTGWVLNSTSSSQSFPVLAAQLREAYAPFNQQLFTLLGKYVGRGCCVTTGTYPLCTLPVAAPPPAAQTCMCLWPAVLCAYAGRTRAGDAPWVSDRTRPFELHAVGAAAWGRAPTSAPVWWLPPTRRVHTPWRSSVVTAFPRK